MIDVMVLGAGVAGLSAAWHAQKMGLNVEIFEKKTRAGGLLDSFEVEGFRFDQGAHFAFSANEPYRKILERTKMHRHQPRPYNYEGGRWLKHPVQNNLYPLPAEEKVAAIKSFVERPALEEAENISYKKWLEAQFGRYIAERYPARYTRKYWTVEADNLSTLWVGNRLYRPGLEEVLLGALSAETPEVYYFKEMLYPKKGGFKALLKPLIEGVKINYLKEVVQVDPKARLVHFKDGTKKRYRHLVSSLPLPELTQMTKGVPGEVKEEAQSLWATSVALVSLGLKKKSASEHLWFYVYDEEILASRVHAPNLKSPDNVPEGMSSLQFEVYYSPYKELQLSREELLEHVIKSGEKMDLFEEKDVMVSDIRKIPYANVVFARGMTKKCDKVLACVRDLKITPVGRFGLWDYLWSDQCFLSGQAVQNLKHML